MAHPFLLFVVRFKSRSVTAENNPKKLRSNFKILFLPNHNERFFPLYFYEGKLIKWFRESLSYSGSYLTRPYCTKLLLFFVYYKMLTLLMFRGANVNATDRKDRRPIHYAAFMGNILLTFFF